MELEVIGNNIERELNNFLGEDFGFLTLVRLTKDGTEIISLELSKELDEVVLILNNVETTRIYFDLGENDIDYVVEKCIKYYIETFKVCEIIIEASEELNQIFE